MRWAPVQQGWISTIRQQRLQQLGMPLQRSQVRGRAPVIVLRIGRMPCAMLDMQVSALARNLCRAVAVLRMQRKLWQRYHMCLLHT